jgi:hypothetical protein
MRYRPGTKIQYRTGYVYIKPVLGPMIAEHRWVATQNIGRELKEGEVVIRKKPNKLDNRWENLVVVQHSLEKFKYLPHSRIIYVPKN